MTSKEAARILAIISTAYPAAWKTVDKQEQVNLWQMLFSDKDAELVASAVKEYILADNEFPPSPGQINSIMNRLLPSSYPHAEEAWEMVLQAMRNSYYNCLEEFTKLPRIVQRTIGRPERLKQLCMMDYKDLSFERNFFLDHYEAILRNPYELSMLDSPEKRQGYSEHIWLPPVRQPQRLLPEESEYDEEEYEEVES